MNTQLKLTRFKYYPSVNFVILGKTILDNMPHKCFNKQAYFNLNTPSCFIVYNTLLTPYHAVLQYNTPGAFLVLYGKHSTDFCIDPPTKSSLVESRCLGFYMDKYGIILRLKVGTIYCSLEIQIQTVLLTSVVTAYV